MQGQYPNPNDAFHEKALYPNVFADEANIKDRVPSLFLTGILVFKLLFATFLTTLLLLLFSRHHGFL